MNRKTNINIIKRTIIIGFALFSMFFGAGNIIFPLYIGANSGGNIIVSSLGFIISAVGVPFLALVATAQYKGDYWQFFSRLGRYPAFIIISLLMIVIGPISAMPRTGLITYSSIHKYLPNTLSNQNIFMAFYFLLVFLFSYKESKIVDIIGMFFSPIKVILFIFLVVLGIDLSFTQIESSKTFYESLYESLLYGYSTMDMFGAFFFCTLAFNSIKVSVVESDEEKIKILIYSSIVGAILLGSVYLGFLYLGYINALELINVAQEELIVVVSQKILGKLGGLFVCVVVSFACISTAIALARVCSMFLYREIFKSKIHHNICLLIVVFLSYFMSILGFRVLLQMLFPILKLVYPCLILYCLLSILKNSRVLQLFSSLYFGRSKLLKKNNNNNLKLIIK